MGERIVSNWEDDKKKADVYNDQIKAILGVQLIGIASVDEDQERNTDLIVMTLKSVRIACRVRSSDYLNFRHEFTIRSGRPSGAKTELAKVIEGWGDYIFYGFGDGEKLDFWTLGCLKSFRHGFCTQLSMGDKNTCPGKKKNNHDGSSSFHIFEWNRFPGMVVAQSTQTNQKPQPNG